MIAFLSVLALAGAIVTPATLSTPSAPPPVEWAGISGGFSTNSTCTADCGPFNGIVSCSGSTCSAVNQDASCPTGPGSVTCDGHTTYCPACCTSGTFRSVTTGPICSCPDGQTTPKDRYECIDGVWVYQFSFCGGPFCQGF